MLRSGLWLFLRVYMRCVCSEVIISAPYAQPLSSYEKDIGTRRRTYKKVVVETESGEDGQIVAVSLS